MAKMRVSVATQEHRTTKRRWWIVIIAFLGPSINHFGRANVGAALRSIGQEFLLNQAQLCLIPASNQRVRRTSRRKTI
jgi:sugar phosphate permease